MPPKKPPPKKSIPNEKNPPKEPLKKLQSKEKIAEKPKENPPEINKKEADKEEKPQKEEKKIEKTAENSIKKEEKPKESNKNEELEEKTEEEKKNDIDEIVNNMILTEKDEKFLIMLSKKLENLDAKIISLKNTAEDRPDKEKITKKQSEVNENLEKLIQQVKENDFEHVSLDKQKDVKKYIENTIIEVFSHNQKLEELVEDMKKGFFLKNQQIFNLQEELSKYQNLCKEQERQIEYLENRLSGKEKILSQYQEDPKKKLAEINEKLRGMQIETTGVKAGNFKENFENPNNNDPYDIWKTNDDDFKGGEQKNNKSQKLEDILGNKNNLWILKHESELNTNKIIKR